MECVFCMEKTTHIDKARKLSCGHCGCKRCLTEITQTHKDVECPTCRMSTKVIDVNLLEKVSLDPTDSTARTHLNGMSTKITDVDSLERITLNPLSSRESGIGMCDICHEQVADVFCVTCQMLLCKAHRKEDQNILHVSKMAVHYRVDANHYLKNKEFYAMHICFDHPSRQTTEACYRCLQQFCTECKMERKCPATDDKHELSSLSDVVISTKHQMANLLAALAAKISSLASLENDTARQIDLIIKDRENLISQVDKTVKEQVEAITQEGELMKTEICRYVQDFVQKAEALTACLMTANANIREHMQTLNYISELTDDGSFLEKFSRTQRENLLRTEYKPLWVPYKHLVPTGEFRTLEVKLEAFTTRSLLYKHSVRNDDCYLSVSHISDSLIVTARTNALEMRDSSLNLIKSIELSSCNDVVPYGGQLVVLQHLIGGTKKIKLYSQNLDYIRDVADLPARILTWSQIAAGSERIAASDPDNKCVYVFSLEGGIIHTISDPGMSSPRGVSIASDGCLLVTDYTCKGSVRKYLLGADYSLVWTSETLPYPWGVQEDCSGHIYVSKRKDFAGSVYQLSSEGLWLRQIICDELWKVRTAMGIAVSCDFLFVACGDEGITKFQLKLE